jgi:DNA (cytosine-5)-methyltransferase 1
MTLRKLTSLEICAGAGGQALGLADAGFRHLALVEIDKDACATLRANRRSWNVRCADLREFAREASPADYPGLDLLAGGVPCPPFSIAGHRRGHEDERDLFPDAMLLVRTLNPRAVMIENVRGILQKKFFRYRKSIEDELDDLGYDSTWDILRAVDYGVPQLRPRAVLVALQRDYWPHLNWRPPGTSRAPMVGDALRDFMSSGGWEGAAAWANQARSIAPTIVGGSKKHGGPDLGPTRAKAAWRALGVDGRGLADTPPGPDTKAMPRLTVPMVAALQGFPPDWVIEGRKTSAYRQVGNAFPPPVAKAVGLAIARALRTGPPIKR